MDNELPPDNGEATDELNRAFGTTVLECMGCDEILLKDVIEGDYDGTGITRPQYCNGYQHIGSTRLRRKHVFIETVIVPPDSPGELKA